MKIREEGRKTGGVARYRSRSQETTKLRAEAQRAAAVPSTNTTPSTPATAYCQRSQCHWGGEEEEQRRRRGYSKQRHSTWWTLNATVGLFY